jgi:hypothetical protein
MRRSGRVSTQAVEGHNDPAATGMSRRSFFGASASWSALVLGFSAASLGCARREESTGLVAAIDSLYGNPKAAGQIAAASGLDRERALALLTSSVPLTSGRTATRQALEERVRDDYLDDRIQLVGRRWLSDTEVAIAVVLSKKVI